MKIILSTNGYEILVDDEDFEELSKLRWYADRGRYTRYARIQTTICLTERMHRLVLKVIDTDILLTTRMEMD